MTTQKGLKKMINFKVNFFRLFCNFIIVEVRYGQITTALVS